MRFGNHATVHGRRLSQGLLGLLLPALLSIIHAEELQPVEPYRQALLIGVWDYTSIPLGAMTSDLDALKGAFDALQYDLVLPLANPTQEQIEAAIGKAVADAERVRVERGVLTVVYFGGHGTMVDHTSYLLARDFVRPMHAAELIVRGGIRVNYIAERFRHLGQPVVIIVDACRNDFVPASMAPEEPPPIVSTPGTTIRPMLGAPDAFFGFNAIYAQAPGAPVEMVPRDPATLTPFVKAIVDGLPNGGEIAGLASEVRDKVMKSTELQTFPQKPQLVAEGGGRILLYYRDIDRLTDDLEWAQAFTGGHEGMVEAFISRFLTSRYVLIARRWLEQRRQASATAQPYVRYTMALRESLGVGMVRRTLGGLANLRPRQVDRSAFEAQLTDGAGVDFDTASVRSMHRLPGNDVQFDVALTSNETVRVEGSLPQADPSRLTDFWTDDLAVAVTCATETIKAKQCTTIEKVVELLQQSDSAAMGTLFVAGIAGGDGVGFAPADNFALFATINERFHTSGVPNERFSFRSFYRSEIPAAGAPILIKRGDAKPIH